MSLRGYDAWRTRAPAVPDPDGEHAVGVRCLDCAWRGPLGAALAHHRPAHHRMRLRSGQPGWDRLVFSCCAEKEEHT
jgi:hypothetical protein